MSRYIAQRMDDELVPECPTDGKCVSSTVLSSLDKNSSDLLQHLMYLSSDQLGHGLEKIHEIFEKRKFRHNYLEKEGEFQGLELPENELKSALFLLKDKNLIDIFKRPIQHFDHIHVKCPKCCLAALDNKDDYAVSLSYNIVRHVEETGIAYELETSVFFLTVHDALKAKNWPKRSIENSILFLLNISLHLMTEKDRMISDISQYFQGLSSEERERFGGEMAAFKITTHYHNEMSSLVSSDDTDDEEQRIAKTWELRTGKPKVIKRRIFGNWVLEKVQEYPNSNALLQAAHIALARLKMHARLAKPSEEILKWAESYRGKKCEQFLLYCILATWDCPDENLEKEEQWFAKLCGTFLQDFTRRLKECEKTDADGLRNWWEALGTLLIYKCRPVTIYFMKTSFGKELFGATSAWCRWTWEENFQDRPQWVKDRVHNTTRQILRIPKLVLSDEEPEYGEEYANVGYFLNMREFARLCASLIVNTEIVMDPEKYGTGSWISNYYYIFCKMFCSNVDARTFVNNVIDFGMLDKIKLLAAQVQTQVLFEKERVEAIFNLFLIVVILYNRLLVPDPIVITDLEMDLSFLNSDTDEEDNENDDSTEDKAQAGSSKKDGDKAESSKKDGYKALSSKKDDEKAESSKKDVAKAESSKKDDKAESSKKDGNKAESSKKDGDSGKPKLPPKPRKKKEKKEEEEVINYDVSNMQRMQSVFVTLTKDLEEALKHPKMNHHFFVKYKYVGHREECDNHKRILEFFERKYKKFPSLGSPNANTKTEEDVKISELERDIASIVNTVSKIQQGIEKVVTEAEDKAVKEDLPFSPFFTDT